MITLHQKWCQYNRSAANGTTASHSVHRFLTEGSGQGTLFKEALDVIFPINSGQGTTPSAMSLILFMRS